MKISVARSAVVVAVAATFGLAIGGGVVAVAATSDAPQSSPESAASDAGVTRTNEPGSDENGTGGKLLPGSDEVLTSKPWAKNEFGLTVGEPTKADVLAGNLPDLMTTFVVNGDETVTGYYLSEEVYPFPDDLVKQTRALLNDKGEEVQTIYAADGKTVLGSRVVSVTTMENAEGQRISPKTGEVIE